jgi:hypothetical protein
MNKLDSKKRFLVIVRAGEKSLHREWLAGESRNWDLLVSWYGNDVYRQTSNETVVNVKGGSGDGIFNTFKAMPGLIDRYDYFWLPDDDIAADCQTINRLFEIASEEELPLCQPALSLNSYFSWFHLLQSKSFRLRYTSFVEVMVPCLSRDRLLEVLPYYENNPSLFGLDMVWARLEKNNKFRAAIIDEIAVCHTRPVGVYLRQNAEFGDRDFLLDLKKLLAKFGSPNSFAGVKCYGGILRGQKSIKGSLVTRLVMFKDYLCAFGKRIQPLSPGQFFAMLVTRNAPLAQLHRIDE